mgnify:CR=1 FL=1
MKVFGINYSKPQKSNYVRFSGRANSYDELITIIPDYKNALERAAQNWQMTFMSMVSEHADR